MLRVKLALCRRTSKKQCQICHQPCLSYLTRLNDVTQNSAKFNKAALTFSTILQCPYDVFFRRRLSFQGLTPLLEVPNTHFDGMSW